MNKNFLSETTFLKIQWAIIVVCIAVLGTGFAARVLHKNPDSEPVLVKGVDYHGVLKNARFAVGDESKHYYVVEYFDYECPPCRGISPTLHQIIRDHQRNSALITHNFPLSMHQHARDLALLACALDSKSYTGFDSKAISLSGKDLEEFIEMWQSKLSKSNPKWKAEATKRLDDENKMASKLNINSTPSLFVIDQIKGTLYECRSFEAINSLLKS